MNKVVLIGNLTRDPQLRETPSKIPVCNFGLAVQRDYSETTDFFNVTVWNAQAENCKKFLSKGKKVAVFGSIQNRPYEDKDGNKRTVVEIVAREVEFLTPKYTQTEEESVVSVKRLPLEAIDDNYLPF